MAKAADALRPGGVLAVITTEHVAGGSTELFARIQRCYERVDPATPPGIRLRDAAETPSDPGEFDRSGRFGAVRFSRFTSEITYSTADYLDLLLTYSGHRMLPAERQDALFAGIAELIDADGGLITKRYLVELAVARRRG